MKKVFPPILNTLIILFTGSSLVFAAVGDKGRASVYKVTITKFEISTDNVNFITLFSGSSVTLDIASVDAGSAIGNFLSGLSVPDGVYTHVKVTVSNTFTISGNVGALYTTAAKLGGACVSGGVAAQAECVVDLSDSGNSLPAPVSDPLPTTLTVVNGVPSHKIRVNFDTSTAMQEAAATTLISAEPTVTMTMISL